VSNRGRTDHGQEYIHRFICRNVSQLNSSHNHRVLIRHWRRHTKIFILRITTFPAPVLPHLGPHTLEVRISKNGQTKQDDRQPAQQGRKHHRRHRVDQGGHIICTESVDVSKCSESRLEYFPNQYGRSAAMRSNKRLKCQESRVHIQGRDGLFSGGGPCSRAVWAQAGPAAGGLLAAVLLPGWESFGGAPGWTGGLLGGGKRPGVDSGE
jgi:hypothetical protein